MIAAASMHAYMLAYSRVYHEDLRARGCPDRGQYYAGPSLAWVKSEDGEPRDSIGMPTGGAEDMSPQVPVWA